MAWALSAPCRWPALLRNQQQPCLCGTLVHPATQPPAPTHIRSAPPSPHHAPLGAFDTFDLDCVVGALARLLCLGGVAAGTRARPPFPVARAPPWHQASKHPLKLSAYSHELLMRFLHNGGRRMLPLLSIVNSHFDLQASTGRARPACLCAWGGGCRLIEAGGGGLACDRMCVGGGSKPACGGCHASCYESCWMASVSTRGVWREAPEGARGAFPRQCPHGRHTHGPPTLTPLPPPPPLYTQTQHNGARKTQTLTTDPRAHTHTRTYGAGRSCGAGG